MLRFLTLGPRGSNHDFVLQRYLQAHGLAGSTIVDWFDDFHHGARELAAGRADYMLQCAVHPDAPDITGGYRKSLFVVDAFISPSRPMALLRARAAGGPQRRVGVQPATQRYADLSSWPVVIEEPTVSAVGEGLLAGSYEAGIAFASVADEHPEALEVVEHIGAVCDAWMVFGRTPLDEGRTIVWTGSPVARQYAAALEGRAPA
ncbi:hypothetical protein AB4Z46_33815 [Variovorax sp. M-6]|uniref:hypothetical protein n=1 Tax=Variovorax sp. M-6 TaxID=3233041 RepID=UPI003F958503